MPFRSNTNPVNAMMLQHKALPNAQTKFDASYMATTFPYQHLLQLWVSS